MRVFIRGFRAERRHRVLLSRTLDPTAFHREDRRRPTKGQSLLNSRDLIFDAGILLVQSEGAPGRPGPLTDASYRNVKLYLPLRTDSFLESTG